MGKVWVVRVMESLSVWDYLSRRFVSPLALLAGYQKIQDSNFTNKYVQIVGKE